MAESENNVLEYHNQKDAMNFLKAKFTSKTLGSSTVDDMKVIGYALGKIAHDNDLVGRIDYDKMLRNLMLGKDRVETDLNRDFEPALEMMYGHLCNIADFGYEVAQQVFTNKISKGSPQCLPEGFTIRYIFNLNEF